MSVDMYLSNSKTQASTAFNMCTKQISDYEDLQRAISSFSLNSPFLMGKAYNSAKAYYLAVLYPLAKGGELLAEAVGEAVKKFPEEYIARVDSGDLKQSVLEEKIKQAERAINQAEEIRNNILSSDIEGIDKTVQLASNGRLIGFYKEIKRELEEKLKRLLEFHSSSPAIFEEITSLQQAVNQGLAVTKKAWNGKTGTFTIPQDSEMGWRKAIYDAPYIKQAKKEYGDHLSQYPDDLEKIIEILKYEEKNPEQVKTTNDFLSPLELKDIIEIKYIIYTAEEPYNRLCLRYMDKFKISDTENSGVFSSSENTLVFNVVEDRTNPRGKYYTFFHEVGHAVDYYSGLEKRNFFEELFNRREFFSDDFQYNGKTLSEYNILDVRNNLRASMREILNGEDYAHLSDNEKKEINNQKIL